MTARHRLTVWAMTSDKVRKHTCVPGIRQYVTHARMHDDASVIHVYIHVCAHINQSYYKHVACVDARMHFETRSN